MSTETHEEFAVARGNEIISDWFPEQRFADEDLAKISDAMVEAKINPDVHVVVREVTVETTATRPHAVPVVEDEPVAGPDGEPVEKGTETLPASGIWGDYDGSIGASLQSTAPGEPAAETPLETVPGEAPLEGAPTEAAAEGAADSSTTVVSTGGEPIVDAPAPTPTKGGSKGASVKG